VKFHKEALGAPQGRLGDGEVDGIASVNPDEV
jgi:hypothetical protein